MGELQRLFGETPRVKGLEAILRLRGMTFNRPELAAEASIHKPSAYRVAGEFVEEGILREVAKGTFEVDETDWRVSALYRIGLELGHQERNRDIRLEGTQVENDRSLNLELNLDSAHHAITVLEDDGESDFSGSSTRPLMVSDP